MGTSAIDIGAWRRLGAGGPACKVVERQALWGTTVLHVWIPGQDAVLRVPEHRLLPLDLDRSASTIAELGYLAAAARVADALERDALLAPLEGALIPLPHQIHALSRAMAGDRVRYLLADEVGLGKTIEAGLILRELEVRGLVRRTLVVAPAGLVSQWASELRSHFRADFRVVQPAGFAALRQVEGLDETVNLWSRQDRVICSLDSVKPLDGRRGWSREQLARYNRERFEDLVSAGWDLIVIDEAHRLGGSTEQVARYRLGEALAQAAPYLLLLSATPHQGKTDAFRRLVGLLDPEALPGDEAVRRQDVDPYVIRTEKRRAIDADGNPLFKARSIRLEPVAWNRGRQAQRQLYEDVTEYVREGYDRARREKRGAFGFLMILMQRLVTSSTAAIRRALERRLEVLQLPEGQLSLFPEPDREDWESLDAQEQMDLLLPARIEGLASERTEVERLLSLARQAEALGPDVKAEALLDWIRRLQREEEDPALKVLVFTEFVPTQEMLAGFLRDRGFPVACLNGSLDLEERLSVQRAFREEAQILVSTDAGGEGLNLQFCHVVVNYDLPWNPMRLEQRIGRVDRIGQAHVVRGLNLALEDTVELRVQEVLEEKLARILEEFGVDKLSDVLDSEEGDVDFETLFLASLLDPGEAEHRAAVLAAELRRRAQAAREGASLIRPLQELDPSAARKLAGSQVPYWVERMTLGYLRSRSGTGAKAEGDPQGYRLRWPDGSQVERAVFSRAEADRSGTVHLTLEDPRVRSLIHSLPVFAPGKPLASLVLPGLSEKVSGLWSLWRVAVQAPEGREQRMLALFQTGDGRMLAPTARAVWDRLLELEDRPELELGGIEGPEAVAAHERARRAAEEHGRPLFAELVERHRQRLERERRKATQAFAARRRGILRIGLPQVREHRLGQLEREEREWSADMERRQAIVPDLAAVLLVQIRGVEAR